MSIAQMGWLHAWSADGSTDTVSVSRRMLFAYTQLLRIQAADNLIKAILRQWLAVCDAVDLEWTAD